MREVLPWNWNKDRWQKNFLESQEDLPKANLSACEGSEEMNFQVSTTGSILDFVGDRVQGWERSSSRVTRLVVTLIGFGATIDLSWLLLAGILDKGGGVLRRGTPTIKTQEGPRKKIFGLMSNVKDKVQMSREEALNQVSTFSLKNHFQIWLGDPWSTNTQPQCFCSNGLYIINQNKPNFTKQQAKNSNPVRR